MNTRWQTVIALRDSDVDYLGHVTAAAHLTLFEEAHVRWLGEVMDDPEPSFVVVRIELDYERELLFADGPVRAVIGSVQLGRSSVTLEEALISDRGVHTRARAVLVRWDRELRRSRPFLPEERGRIGLDA